MIERTHEKDDTSFRTRLDEASEKIRSETSVFGEEVKAVLCEINVQDDAMIARNVTDPDERRRCRKHLLRWWFVNWNAARVGVDLVALVAPGFLHRAERFKQRVFSPEPGPDASGKRAKRG